MTSSPSRDSRTKPLEWSSADDRTNPIGPVCRNETADLVDCALMSIIKRDDAAHAKHPIDVEEIN